MENCIRIEILKKNFKGRIITRESNKYPDARLNWDPYTSHYPCYIVYPTSESDIIKCIKWCI